MLGEVNVVEQLTHAGSTKINHSLSLLLSLQTDGQKGLRRSSRKRV